MQKRKINKIFDEDYINVSISQPSNAPGVFYDRDVNEEKPKVDKDTNEVGYDWPLMSRLENNDFVNQMENLDQDNIIMHDKNKKRKIKKTGNDYQVGIADNDSNIYEPKVSDNGILESLINYIMDSN